MFGVGIVLLFLSARAADGLIFQSSVIDQAGAVNFTMQVSFLHVFSPFSRPHASSSGVKQSK
jgi:hypothetical protein